MLWSEYMDEVKSDAMDAIKENLEYNDSWDEMYDSLFMDDSVTGNTCDVIARCVCLGLVSGELEEYYDSLTEDEDED